MKGMASLLGRLGLGRSRPQRACSDLDRWRRRAHDLIWKVTLKLKDHYSSRHYDPDRYDSPRRSAGEAEDAANNLVGDVTGESWDSFRTALIAAIEERRNDFRASHSADPDGYVCSTLNEFAAALRMAPEYEPAPVPPPRRKRQFDLATIPVLALLALVVVGIVVLG